MKFSVGFKKSGCILFFTKETRNFKNCVSTFMVSISKQLQKRLDNLLSNANEVFQDFIILFSFSSFVS